MVLLLMLNILFVIKNFPSPVSSFFRSSSLTSSRLISLARMSSFSPSVIQNYLSNEVKPALESYQTEKNYHFYLGNDAADADR
jgi:hypothetical protein